MQKKLIPLFHYSLNPGGILFLGSAETIGDFTDLFAPLDGKSRLFRRIESVPRPEPVIFPSSFSAVPPGGTASPSGCQTAGQSPDAGGSVGAAALFPAGRADQ